MKMIYCLVMFMFICFCEGKSLSKQSRQIARKLADEIVDVKVNIEYVKRQKTPKFNFETCRNTTAAQCHLCKQKVVEDEDYCDKPKTIEQKCLCLAANHQWRTMYENVDDKLQTVEEACAFVCDVKQPQIEDTLKVNETVVQTKYPNGTTTNETVKTATTSGTSSIFVMISISLLLFIF